MPSHLFLTREEFWTLTQHIGADGYPGLDFSDLDALEDEDKARLLDLTERVLLTRGMLGRRRNGTLYVREPVVRLLRYGLVPERIYFYGQRLPAGEERMHFFVHEGRYAVLTQPATGLLHLLPLSKEEQLLRIMYSVLDLGRYRTIPDRVAIEVPRPLLETLAERIQQQPEPLQEHVRFLQNQGVDEPAATALAETYQKFAGYHGFVQMYPRTEPQKGLAFLQGERWLWWVKRGNQGNLRLQAITAAQALAALRKFFEIGTGEKG